MTGRWGFLIGLAGFGFFLYSALHPSRPDLPGGAAGVPPADSWQPLSASPAPTWSKSVGLPTIPGRETPLEHTSGGTPDRHDLNTRSTVYLGAPESPLPPENPLLGLVRTFLSGNNNGLPELSAVRRPVPSSRPEAFFPEKSSGPQTGQEKCRFLFSFSRKPSDLSGFPVR